MKNFHDVKNMNLLSLHTQKNTVQSQDRLTIKYRELFFSNSLPKQNQCHHFEIWYFIPSLNLILPQKQFMKTSTRSIICTIWQSPVMNY